MNEQIQSYLVYFVVFLLTTLIGAGVNYLLALAKVKLGADKWATLTQLAGVAVKASEQAIKVSGLTGDEAFDLALGAVESGLAKYGYSFPDDVVHTAIEAAVKDMNDWRDVK